MRALVAASLLLAATLAAAQNPPDVPKPGIPAIQAPFSSLKSVATFKIGKDADWILITEDTVWVTSSEPASIHRIDPKTNTLVAGEEARVMQAFKNMQLIAESEGASLRDAVRLVVYVTDMYRFRPLVNKVQEQLWGAGPYPPRTIIEVHRLNQDDIVEVEGTFYAPRR